MTLAPCCSTAERTHQIAEGKEEGVLPLYFLGMSLNVALSVRERESARTIMDISKQR